MTEMSWLVNRSKSCCPTNYATFIVPIGRADRGGSIPDRWGSALI